MTVVISNYLTIVKKGLYIVPEGLVHVAGAGGHNFGKTERHQFALCEERVMGVYVVQRVQ